MRIYADTSLLFSLYASDANSGRADQWRYATPEPLPFTSFHRLELRNALSLALFQQRLAPFEVQAAWQEVENDCSAGLLIAIQIPWPVVMAEAETFSASHTPQVGSRTLDVLHVAAARIIGASEFCSFDSRQSSLADLIGLSPVLP